MSTTLTTLGKNGGLLGTGSDITGFPTNVYYDAETGKIYERPLSGGVFLEVLDQQKQTIYRSNFVSQINKLDKNYQSILREKNPESEINPETRQLIEQARNNPVISSDPADQNQGSQPVSLDIKGSGKSRETANSFGDHRYPEGLAQTKQDIMKFTMLKYEPRKFQAGQTPGGGLNFGGFAERSKDRLTLGTVILPIPAGISETNGANWGGESMDPAKAILANIALTSIKEGIEGGVGVAAAAIEGAGGNSEVKNAFASLFAQEAAQVGNLLSRTQGAIFNPNLELLFDSPTLRPFNFTFKLSARSKDEAKQIIRIIRFFKQGMSPQKSESNLFLRAPHTFKIQYIHRPLGPNADHPYIGQIKECALQNFNVSYTPEGQYATFSDGVMVSYEIQMTFQELEPVFNEDYGSTGSLPDNLLFDPAQ